MTRMDKNLNCQDHRNWAIAGQLLVDLSSMEYGFLEIYPVRNSSRALNPAGIILKRNPAIGGTAEQWGIISNGVKRYRQEIWEYIQYRESLVKWPSINQEKG